MKAPPHIRNPKMQAGGDISDLGNVQQKIVAKRFDSALTDLASILKKDRNNVEALYMQAVCLRYLNRFDQALATLAELKSLAPEHGRAHQEEGHTYRDLEQPEEAVIAYSRACRFNPALIASWQGLSKIYKSKAMEREAVQVDAQLERLQSMPPQLVGIMDLIAQGRLLKAEDYCRQFLLKIPNHVEGMRLLADIGMRLGVLDDAEFLLESALKFEPNNTPVRIDYVRSLRKRQKFAAALEQAELLLETAPQNPQFQSMFAVESLQNGNYDQALQAFDKVLAHLPGDPTTLTSKGHLYKTCGEYDNAVSAYQAATDSQPYYGEAYYSLANLKVYSFADAEIESMQTQVRNSNLSYLDRVYFLFALGKAFEDREEFDAAFDYYSEGNRLKKIQSRYNAEEMSADLRAQHDVCTEAFFASRSDSGHSAPDPIFIVGLPRAGSTLLEQILSSHSMVDGTLELPNILSLSQRLRRRGRQSGSTEYPAVLGELSPSELQDFGEAFIEDTRIHRQDAPYFIDKMPNNFRHIGLIHLILPNAKIIDARRHPMSCCFSGFKQLFAEGQEFSYDLTDIGRYYTDYVALMDHWDTVLPGRILRVQYEDVVADVDSQVRRILDFCELPFEDACVRFHETERAVRTPSSEQVRQPIFQSGLAQWRNFEHRLQPLKAALGGLINETETERVQPALDQQGADPVAEESRP